jgi:hypothetical protein
MAEDPQTHDTPPTTRKGRLSPGPMAVLREAIKAVPAVKYALGVGGVGAVIALWQMWGLALSAGALGAVIMILLMALLLIFSYATTSASKWLRLPAIILVYFSLVTTIATTTLIFTSAFFAWPMNLKAAIDPTHASNSHLAKTARKIMDDITDILSRMGYSNTQTEKTSAGWNREEQVINEAPYLIVIHQGCFYPAPRGTRLTDQEYERAEAKLITFIDQTLERLPTVKFLVYTRTLKPNAPDEDKTAFEKQMRALKAPARASRVRVLLIPRDRADFTNPYTVKNFKSQFLSAME